MYKKYLTVILIFMINWGVSFLYSQATGYQSPDVAAMLTPAKVDVNYYTGSPNISLPIYTIEDGDLIIPINLNYYGGGIKHDRKSTKVGL